MGECPEIYSRRLIKQGWQKGKWIQLEKHNACVLFTKPVNNKWTLVKIFYVDLGYSIGKGCYYEEHQLKNIKTGEQADYPLWEWADIDGGRLVWAEQGMIKASKVGDDGLNDNVEILCDFNEMEFEEIVAPY